MGKLLRVLFFIGLLFLFHGLHAQRKNHLKKNRTKEKNESRKSIARYGVASFYATKFHGSKTYSGEIYRNEKFTAACNVVPLNTWIKVTNLKNNKTVIAKVNDRLHKKNKRLVDLSKSAAQKLGYVSSGLARVKVEVLDSALAERAGS